jgi:hypothetical protein
MKMSDISLTKIYSSEINLGEAITRKTKMDGPPLWSSGQSSRLQIQRYRVRFPALPDFLKSCGYGTGSTQPREDN